MLAHGYAWLMEEFVSDTFSHSLDDFTVMLRIRHPNIDPAEITQTLGLVPQHSWRAGETRRTAQGAPLEGAYRESFWTAEFQELESGLKGVREIEAVLMTAVVQLRRSQAFLSKLHSESGTVELSVEIMGSRDFTLTLSPQLVSLLARAGVSLVLTRTEAQVAERRKTG
jgi:hypothetical protein